LIVKLKKTFTEANKCRGKGLACQPQRSTDGTGLVSRTDGNHRKSYSPL